MNEEKSCPYCGDKRLWGAGWHEWGHRYQCQGCKKVHTVKEERPEPPERPICRTCGQTNTARQGVRNGKVKAFCNDCDKYFTQELVHGPRLPKQNTPESRAAFREVTREKNRQYQKRRREERKDWMAKLTPELALEIRGRVDRGQPYRQVAVEMDTQIQSVGEALNWLRQREKPVKVEEPWVRRSVVVTTQRISPPPKGQKVPAAKPPKPPTPAKTTPTDSQREMNRLCLGRPFITYPEPLQATREEAEEEMKRLELRLNSSRRIGMVGFG